MFSSQTDEVWILEEIQEWESRDPTSDIVSAFDNRVNRQHTSSATSSGVILSGNWGRASGKGGPSLAEPSWRDAGKNVAERSCKPPFVKGSGDAGGEVKGVDSRVDSGELLLLLDEDCSKISESTYSSNILKISCSWGIGTHFSSPRKLKLINRRHPKGYPLSA